jgi:hypothetical protein
MSGEFDFDKIMLEIKRKQLDDASRREKGLIKEHEQREMPNSRNIPVAERIIDLTSRFINWNKSNGLEPTKRVSAFGKSVSKSPINLFVKSSLWLIKDQEKVILDLWQGDSDALQRDAVVTYDAQYAELSPVGETRIRQGAVSYGFAELSNPSNHYDHILLRREMQDSIVSRVAELAILHSLNPHTF